LLRDWQSAAANLATTQKNHCEERNDEETERFAR